MPLSLIQSTVEKHVKLPPGALLYSCRKASQLNMKASNARAVAMLMSHMLFGHCLYRVAGYYNVDRSLVSYYKRVGFARRMLRNVALINAVVSDLPEIGTGKYPFLNLHLVGRDSRGTYKHLI